MIFEDLGRMAYRDAWAVQERAHAGVVAGGEERVLFVEHPPVITFGRRTGIEKHLIASDDQLKARSVEVVQSDRGGDITFHGPGQIVVYPIIRLIDHRLSVGAYVHKLEEIVILALEELSISARREPGAVGVWVDDGKLEPAKICAFGVRVRQGVTMHGLALNVETDLSFFDLIIPCGLNGRRVTSVRSLKGSNGPTIDTVKQSLHRHLAAAFQAHPGVARRQ
jgi:lipoyl(octanoyl) transferase